MMFYRKLILIVFLMYAKTLFVGAGNTYRIANNIINQTNKIAMVKLQLIPRFKNNDKVKKVLYTGDTEKMHLKGVYKIHNVKNGREYIGRTTDSFKVRWRGHAKRLNSNKHRNIRLQADYNKHGLDCFVFIILFATVDDEASQAKELYYINNSSFRNYNIQRCKHSKSDCLSIINDYVYERMTTRQLSLKYKIASGKIKQILHGDYLHTRDINQALLLKAKAMLRSNKGIRSRKLTEEQVRYARHKYSCGEAGYKSLGKELNMSPSTIRHLILRKTYKHVT